MQQDPLTSLFQPIPSCHPCVTRYRYGDTAAPQSEFSDTTIDSIMAISFVFIGVLAMLDVLFFVNFLAVKWIRAWTDQREEQLEANQSLSLASTSACKEPHSNSCLPNMCNRSSSAPSSTTVYFKAFFMDVVHREQTSVHKFDKWRDLPYACGKWSTVFLLLFSLSLLSVEFMVSTELSPSASHVFCCRCSHMPAFVNIVLDAGA